MQIQTGKTPISLMTVCAILSISLVVNLPGLAVTPMLGSLSEVFPRTTQLEKQLLTVLPNLLIIPFTLLSGKLSLTRHKIAIVVTGLVVFSACAVFYLFASTMWMLIVISCLLGCGAGLLIPFSSGLIADTFVGPYRMKEMGIKSGISNLALVAATFAVGWLSHGSWHLPFVVYLVALIPLALSFGLRGIPSSDLEYSDGHASAAAPAATATAAAAATPGAAVTAPRPSGPLPPPHAPASPDVRNGFYVKRIWALISVYAFITFSTIAMTYYCPFLIEKKGWSSSLTGTITSVFYLFMFIPGFTLPWFVKILRGGSFVWCAAFMTVGMALFAFFPNDWSMIVGAALCGLGYGICQPLIYDKASRAVTSDNKATLALAFVLSSNYLAIVLTPFIIDGLRDIFHAHSMGTFAFTVCFVLLVAYTVVAWLLRHKFAFAIKKDYY